MDASAAALTILRTILISGGGYFIGQGLVTGAQWDQISGAIITLAGGLWALYPHVVARGRCFRQAEGRVMETSVVIAIIYAVPPTVAAICSALVSLRNGRKIKALHREVDGRLTQLIARTAEASRLQGAADVTNETARTAEIERRRAP